MAKAKTLVIQPLQGIGDYMWFVRHLQAIAQSTPKKKISLLTRPRSFADQLSDADPCIDEVIWLQIKKGTHDGLAGLMRLAKVLRQKGYTQAYILHSRSLRYPILCRLAGIPKVYGPGMGLQALLLNRPATFLKKADQKKHPIIRGTQVMKNHGLDFAEEVCPLKLSAAHEAAAETFLKDVKPPYFALCIGSSEAEKKWPAAHFIALGEMIAKRKKGTLFILGGPSEAAEGKNIEMVLTHKKIPAVFVSGDLCRTLAILKRCAFVVGNDTGVTHAAPMLGVHGIVLLGQSQVPIHRYTGLEGVKYGAVHQLKMPNHMEKINPPAVLEKLISLGWV